MHSSLLLTYNPIEDLGVSDEDVAKVLFLSTNPVHRKHNETDEQLECNICRVIEKLQKSIKSRNMSSLKRELQTKTSKLTCANTLTSPKLSTLDTNFEEDCDELNQEEEELLTFTEVLDLIGARKPKILEDKLQNILTTKKITYRKMPKQNMKVKKRKTNSFRTVAIKFSRTFVKH